MRRAKTALWDICVAIRIRLFELERVGGFGAFTVLCHGAASVAMPQQRIVGHSIVPTKQRNLYRPPILSCRRSSDDLSWADQM